MTGTFLECSLKMVAQRLYKLRVLRRQALCWVLLLVPAIVLATTAPQLHDLIPTELLVLLGMTIAGLGFARWKVPSPTAIETAQLVEKHRPELNDAVLTAVQASQRSRSGRSKSVLSNWAIDEADLLARKSNWKSVVPRRQMLAWSLLSFLAFCFLVTGVVAAGRWGRHDESSRFLPKNIGVDDANDRIVADLVVEPGDVEIERGSAVTVVARFGRVIPGAAQLMLTTEAGNGGFTMDPTVDEGVFAATVSSVESDAHYRVFFGDSQAALISGMDRADFRNKSDEFKISTYVRPRLERVDATITPPAYTQKPPQMIEDTQRISAVEGSVIALTLRLNKPVAVAELRSKAGAVIPLVVVAAESASDVVSMTAEIEAIDDQQYRVYLEDDFGRTAAQEEAVTIRVLRNQRPKIKVTFPGRDTNVSPLQEFQIEAEAIDDFGLSNFGVSWTLSDGTADEVSLATPSVSDVDGETSDSQMLTGKVTMAHTIDMEKLKAEPDQLLSYSFFVDDIAADGMSRRTYSDMMFAEVRRFEEIFRESQQPSSQQQQQQQQGSQQTEELMQLQREIMIATWNVRRDLDAGRSQEKATAAAKDNANVLLESQQAAIEQLQDLKEEAAADADMLQLVTDVEIQMQQAQQDLTGVVQQPTFEGLTSALAAEQAAIAGLLRLRAKEHEIQRGQQQGQGKGQNSASQQQLRQLELDNERQRYESESQAQQQQQQNEEQGQQLQILNRLKELARRQQMLNERLKQLESELRAAETEAEKAEIERELKRLREEQREMLRDVDELRETMDQQSTEQQQQNQETRQQVDQARDRVQQASRAMDEGELSEAIAEGTRAEREFDELQEKFRNQTSNQFSEAMRELRDQTRQMKERQKEIARELAGEDSASDETGQLKLQPQQPSLRNTQDREGLQQKVAEQRDELERVLERAKHLVEESEESEPLLSRRLYDTIRETRDTKAEQALEAAEILVSRGLYQQGQQVEEIARDGVESLADGIENAADAVLGSEAESLRRAQQEIEDLTQQLSSEIAQATGAGQKSAAGEDGEDQQGMPGDAAKHSESRGQGEGDGERPASDQQGGGSEGQPGQQAKDQPAENSEEASSSSSGQPSDTGEGRPNESSSPKGQGEGQRQGQSQQSAGESSSGQPGGESNQEQQQAAGGRQAGGGSQSFLLSGGREASRGGAAANQGRPLTGDDYSDWSNRMREVEEILEDSDLRNQVAQVRDRARSIRAEFRRHGTEPQWDLVKSELLDEMVDLQRRIQQELRKMDTGRSMVPIDREPVPEEFDELVRRYYELLGQSREEAE